MERAVLKTRKIKKCVIGPASDKWLYKIVWLNNKPTFGAELWGYNDDYDYLNTFSLQESSPEFSTKEAAEAYALKEWEIG